MPVSSSLSAATNASGSDNWRRSSFLRSPTITWSVASSPTSADSSLVSMSSSSSASIRPCPATSPVMLSRSRAPVLLRPCLRRENNPERSRSDRGSSFPEREDLPELEHEMFSNLAAGYAITPKRGDAPKRGRGMLRPYNRSRHCLVVHGTDRHVGATHASPADGHDTEFLKRIDWNGTNRPKERKKRRTHHRRRPAPPTAALSGYGRSAPDPEPDSRNSFQLAAGRSRRQNLPGSFRPAAAPSDSKPCPGERAG